MNKGLSQFQYQCFAKCFENLDFTCCGITALYSYDALNIDTPTSYLPAKIKHLFSISNNRSLCTLQPLGTGLEFDILNRFYFVNIKNDRCQNKRKLDTPL